MTAKEDLTLSTEIKKPRKKAAAKVPEIVIEKPIEVVQEEKLTQKELQKITRGIFAQSNKLKFEFPKVTQDPETILKKLKVQVPLLIALVAILSSVLTFVISKQFQQDQVDQTSFVAKISGGVVLTESELIDVVRQIKTDVYWVGPLDGAKYTINASTPGQIYVRYLPDGKGVNDLSPKYRVVGTYAEKDAYSSTLAAGNEANGVSFVTPEGSVVHYNKSAQSNVYVAFQGKEFQIEVFDPDPSKAMALATAAKSIRLIR